jgi:hypothetical protein
MESYDSNLVAKPNVGISTMLGMPSSIDLAHSAQAAFFVHNPSSQPLSIIDCKIFSKHASSHGKL